MSTENYSAWSGYNYLGIGGWLRKPHNRCPRCHSVEMTYSFHLLMIPIIPLAEFRVKQIGPLEYVGRRLKNGPGLLARASMR